MKLKVNLIFLFLLGLSGCSQTEPSASVLWQDLQARRQLKAEKYEEALQSYYNLVELNPNLAVTHSNIGVILNFVQRPEDALKSFEHALTVAKENKDLLAEFAVQFNMGEYFGKAKNVDKALEHYQAALDIIPSSIETKTNIELMIKQQQNQQGQGEKSEKDQQNQNGQSGNSQNQNNKDNKDQKDQKDQKKDGSEDQKKDQNDKGDKDKDENKPDEGKKRESSPKYKPRPFKGEQLSEGDVKKILGELRSQEQKIRANFEKKEKGKTRRNEKDW